MLVFELGSAVWRFGAAGERRPRWSTASLSDLCESGAGRSPRRSALRLLPALRRALGQGASTGVAGQAVLIVCDGLAPGGLCAAEALSNCLLRYCGAESVRLLRWAPSCALYTTGARTGLVLDVGGSEARCVCLWRGHLLPQTWHAAPLGVGAGGAGGESGGAAALREKWFCADPLGEAEGETLSRLVLRALARCPIDARRGVAAHIVLCGGGAARAEAEGLDLGAALLEALRRDAAAFGLEACAGGAACGGVAPELLPRDEVTFCGGALVAQLGAGEDAGCSRGFGVEELRRWGGRLDAAGGVV